LVGTSTSHIILPPPPKISVGCGPGLRWPQIRVSRSQWSCTKHVLRNGNQRR